MDYVKRVPFVCKLMVGVGGQDTPGVAVLFQLTYL